ncbi:MAG: metal ABC transporter substrate-binding protein, partial [Myxococcota bacterium]|nr:metal ABC transporter substrate-binding protein [Myxococcota bacterium]
MKPPFDSRHVALTTIALALPLLLFAGEAGAVMRVVTTTTDLAALVREVGGARVRVTAICKGGQDPHHLRARPGHMVLLSRADLLVAVGLELEVGWLPLLVQGARNPAINPGRPGYLDASTAITAIEVPRGGVDRSGGDVHAFGNPHYWLDPENGRKVAALVAHRLARLDPGGSAHFEARRKAFDARLVAAIARWTRAMAPRRGTPVVSYHRTFSYLFARFGLRQAGTVEERPG